MARTDDHAKRVADALIEQLKRGTAPWQRPWEPGRDRSAPYNAATGKNYRGGNAIFLWGEGIRQGYEDPRWMTYRQASAMGAQVRKGEHGTPIEYWIREGKEPVKDANGRTVKNADGKQVYRDVKYDHPRVMHFTVFSGNQVDGLPAAKPRDVPHEWERHACAEAILANSGARIEHGGGDRAFYSPHEDKIVLPDRTQFPSADRYYATSLHELGHWTGHPDRLNRDLSEGFGSEAYAREELRAEISSMMIGDKLGIGHDPGQHAAYVSSWIQALENDPREIFRAARDAECITDFVMQYEARREHQQEQEHDTSQERQREQKPEPVNVIEQELRERVALSDAATAASAEWRRREWEIEPDLHRTAVPELGLQAGEVRQGAGNREAEADMEDNDTDMA